jgi:hypothetical protein
LSQTVMAAIRQTPISTPKNPPRNSIVNHTTQTMLRSPFVPTQRLLLLSTCSLLSYEHCHLSVTRALNKRGFALRPRDTVSYYKMGGARACGDLLEKWINFAHLACHLGGPLERFRRVTKYYTGWSYFWFYQAKATRLTQLG